MNCIYCGNVLMEGARFCAMCGQKVEDVCPACGAKKMEGARFCAMCGQAFESAPAASKSTTAPKKTKAAPAVNRTPSLPGSMRQSYSNFQTFANWAAETNRYVVGNPAEHFILHSSYDSNAVYRVAADGAEAKRLENISFEVRNMFWGDGLLWLVEGGERREGVYRIYAYDTEDNTCQLVVDLSKVAKKYYLNNPYVTAASIYLLAESGTGEGWEQFLLRVDRKNGQLSTLYKAACGIRILGIDDKRVWLSDQDDGGELSLLVDHNGKTTPVYKHPDIKALLPLIIQKTGNTEYERKNCDSAAEYEAGLARFCSNFIQYIDFAQRRVYFSDEWGCQPSSECHWLSFGAASMDDVHTYWKKPWDFSCAFRDGRFSCTKWYSLKLFDGKHAVGQGNGGTNYEWCYQTADGAMIDLGRFDRCENDFATLGDDLYVYGVFEECWHRFRLTAAGAKLTIIQGVE